MRHTARHGFRFLIVMSHALTARVQSWQLSIDQPTMLRVKVSIIE